MQPIAVIGLSCLYPEAKTPEDYWKNLLQEKDSSTSAAAADMDADPSRFFAEKKGTPDKYYCARGGYINDFKMDPDGFYCLQKPLKNWEQHFNGLFTWLVKRCVTVVI